MDENVRNQFKNNSKFCLDVFKLNDLNMNQKLNFLFKPAGVELYI